MRNLPLVYKAEGKFWVNNHAHILKPKRDDYDYMAHTLESADYRNYITGSAQPKLTQENLQAVRIPVPPLAEQKEIVAYIEHKTKAIDTSIAKAERQIELLKEYKQSLVTECVTGKRKVC
jgi:type I restriction enzyme S subunit